MRRVTDSPRLWKLESGDAMHVPSLRAVSEVVRVLVKANAVNVKKSLVSHAATTLAEILTSLDNLSSGNLVANLIEKSSISVLYRLSDLFLSGYLAAESLERSKSVRAAPMSPAKLENYQANLAP
jgi:hypothetical protein